MQIAQTIKERVLDRKGPAKYYSLEEMEEYFKSRGIIDV
jgi:hypothetical protein